jgi:hypothetical protein
MKVFTDYCEFARETGRLIDWRLAERLGISPRLPTIGTYELDELQRLEAFCRDHPEYHILSQITVFFLVNRVDPRARNYLLGNGNADADLCFLGRKQDLIGLKEALKLAKE